MGRIKSTPSRILRPAPRRRAIVAPRFGKWARVLKCLHAPWRGPETHPARSVAPVLILSVHPWGPSMYSVSLSGLSLSLYPFPQTCVTYRRDRRSRCTARTGVTLNSPSYCPGRPSARQSALALSQYAPTTAVYQPRPALIFLRKTHSAPACHISVPNLRIPRVLAGATGIDPNFSPRGRQAGDIPTRPTPREFRKPALRLP